MISGDRIEERRKALGIKSQAELGRRSGIGQTTINGLIRNPYRSSPHLTKLARTLQTTVEYLMGETDDPSPGAALPPLPDEPIHHVMLAVALPPERALARMFEGLLDGLPKDADRDEQALLLARRLPIGLAQLRDLLPPDLMVVRGATPELATPVAAPRR